ncbi:MAG: DUF2007 domain-containing protein [Acidobacteriaceae bacterium]
MGPAREELATRYAAMSELELMELAQGYDSLTEEAQTVLRAEFARRQLEPPVIKDRAEDAEPVAREVVTVRRYRDLSEAIVAQSLLESALIKAWTRDENLVRMDWFYSNLVGGVRLQVDAADAAAAAEVLDQPVPEAIPFGEKEEFVQPRCPRCGSVDISFLGSDRRAALASVTLVGVPLPLGNESWECHACGARWQDTGDDAGTSRVEEK